MKSLCLFLITLTTFISISNFAYGSSDKTNDKTDAERKFADFLTTLPIAEGMLKILEIEPETEPEE